ncbi:MAG TPA: hypothetical protein VMF03_10885 [Steroidobacteraceae bacterium]|nr:hypothetical protein [Steroidobacteraceae bacterium]
MIRPVVSGIVLALLASLATAAPNSARRVQAFARLPDWTGLWETALSKALTTAGGRSAGTGGAYLKLVGHPPFNPEWEQKYQAALASPAVQAARDETLKGCGIGSPEYVRSFPNIMEAPMVFQVVVTPEETLFVMDHGEVRHIYTDRRTHPGADDLWPTPLGDSIGHWEGQTLVIDTIARTAGVLSMFSPAAELSARAHFIERVHQTDKNTLEDRLTIDDPERFIHPWVVTFRYTRAADLTRFIPYDCEADRNPIENGKLTIAPP